MSSHLDILAESMLGWVGDGEAWFTDYGFMLMDCVHWRPDRNDVQFEWLLNAMTKRGWSFAINGPSPWAVEVVNVTGCIGRAIRDDLRHGMCAALVDACGAQK